MPWLGVGRTALGGSDEGCVGWTGHGVWAVGAVGVEAGLLVELLSDEWLTGVRGAEEAAKGLSGAVVASWDGAPGTVAARGGAETAALAEVGTVRCWVG